MSRDAHRPDVLTVALFLAAAVHAVVILGVSFRPFLDEMRTPPALEVVLVQERADDERPDEADYIAQASRDGGGQSDDNARPSAPFASDLDLDTDGVAPAPVLAGAPPRPTETAADEVLTAIYSDETVRSEERAEERAEVTLPPSTVLIEQNLEIAALQQEIDRRQEEFAKRPRIKTVNARTTEASSAEYMYRWVEKVERIGNLNYPPEARKALEASRRAREGGSGRMPGPLSLVLIVGIYKNGDIESVTIDESSGYTILDKAARQIVEQAGPFDPMSGKLAEETDILYIVRTWEFGDVIISY